MKTKAGTNRTVPIHPRIRPLVIKWYNKAQELNSEYLFNCTDTNTAKSNLMLTYDKYRRRIEALVDALELNPDHRPHDGSKPSYNRFPRYTVSPSNASIITKITQFSRIIFKVSILRTSKSFVFPLVLTLRL